MMENPIGLHLYILLHAVTIAHNAPVNTSMSSPIATSYPITPAEHVSVTHVNPPSHCAVVLC